MAVLASLTKNSVFASSDITSCGDFEGRWEAIDVDNASTLKISISCKDEDTANVIYIYNRWGAPTCGFPRNANKREKEKAPPNNGFEPNNGGPGVFILDYEFGDESIERSGAFNVTCENGSIETFEAGAFGPNGFGLKENGSLDWLFDGDWAWYIFWRAN